MVSTVSSQDVIHAGSKLIPAIFKVRVWYSTLYLIYSQKEKRRRRRRRERERELYIQRDCTSILSTKHAIIIFTCTFMYM